MAAAMTAASSLIVRRFSGRAAGSSSSRSFTRLTPVCMGRRSAKIAGRKEKQDAAKTKLYGKFGKMIISTAKEKGVDPSANLALAKLLAEARAQGVPKEIVERNLKRASESKQASFTEVVYEAYGAGGLGLVVEGLTDNVNRAAAEIKVAIVRGGGKMAASGSVLFNFKRVGVLVVPAASGVSEDELMEAAIDAGAEDVQAVGGDGDGGGPAFRVLTAPEDFGTVRDALAADGGIAIEGERSGLVLQPTALVSGLADKDLERNEALIERLLELDDVDAVFSQLPESE